jgi:hypothetical protein
MWIRIASKIVTETITCTEQYQLWLPYMLPTVRSKFTISVSTVGYTNITYINMFLAC